MARGRKKYDTADPYAYPVSRLARHALQARLEDAVDKGRLPADHDLYLQILAALFPEDFTTPAIHDPDRRLRRLRAAAYATRLQQKAVDG